MTAVWKCEDQRASLTLAHLSGELDLLRPWMGVHQVRFLGCDTRCRLMMIDPAGQSAPAEILDSYTRGDDLVVTYGQTQRRPVRQQVYWRALNQLLPEGVLLGLDLIISMETSLLYSDPSVKIVSEFPAGAGLRCESEASLFIPLPAELRQLLESTSGGSLLLLRPSGANFSIVQCVHPSDFEQAEIAPSEGGGLKLTCRLFLSPLEKGVIRRGRLRAVLVARENDERLARCAYDLLAAAPPPLTA